MDESRKQFEWWYLLNWGHTEDNEDSMFEVDTRHGNYQRLGVRMAYDAWQASRAAIEINLPPKAESSPYEHYMPHYTMDADSVESAIRAAGIKVKE
ncbi:TPA: hypothetical protein ACRRD7_000615 [Enterobacter hormaechei]|uniref:hypothetical protein n=1 Tax=Enterobacter hormaechei TaxID=158836 RepID=UPI0025701394|nr:hypothetical protein [Enterobacter hormaechei]MCM8117118.1 hypothetical protein [Enterobacter hormaechei]MDL4434905.1 hypothetical protein [Enterobacter hormaechei]